MIALVVVDMQEDYVGVYNKYGYESSKLIEDLNSEIINAYNCKYLIIYIKNEKHLKSGVKVPELAKNLKIKSEYIFNKHTSSIFTNEDFINCLQYNNISELEIIGIDGNCCVASSAKDAINKGYNVSFPLKLIGVKNQERFIKTVENLKKLGVNVKE